MTTLIGRRWKCSDACSRAVLIVRKLARCAPPQPLQKPRYFANLLGPERFRPNICHIIKNRSLCFTENVRWRLTKRCQASFDKLAVDWHKDLGGHGDGVHPFPSRTGKLSPFAPMVLPHTVGE